MQRMHLAERLRTGTTTVGIVCKDGIVLAADRRASMGYLVASKSFKKVYKITPNMAMTMAGSVGDAQMMVRLLRAEMKLYELAEKKVTTKAAATLLANILRSAYKSFVPELVQLMLGGFDERGPQLYSLDPIGSVTPEDEYSFSGSGSPVAVGVLEDSYRRGMSVEDGAELAARALRAARERDIATGPKGMDIVTITKRGVYFLSEEKIAKFLKEKEK